MEEKPRLIQWNNKKLLAEVDLSFKGWVLFFTMCAAGIGGTFQYGYNLTIMNAPTTHIQKFVNETWLDRYGSELDSWIITLIWSIIVSVFPLGGFMGALLAGPMAIRLGRKKSLLFNNFFIILSAIFCGFSRYAKSFEMIIVGRILAGVNSGVSMNIQPMYLGESAPKNLRGTGALSCAVSTAIGLVMGQVLGLRELLGSEEVWPLLLASNVVPGILQLMVLPWVPESPRYLLIDLKDKDSCVVALRRFRGNCDFSTEVEEMVAEQTATQGQRPKSLCELIREPSLRRQLLTIVVLSSAMQLCGNDSMYFYASYVFQAAGISSEKIQYVVIGTGSCELITSITCTLVIDRVGRRVLVMGGYSFMSVWAVVFMVALSQQERVIWMPYLCMVCIFAYILSFGIGPAGVTGLMPAEIFDQMARPAAYMICGSLMWLFLFVVGLAFPFIVQGLGHFCFMPFLVVCVSTTIYIGFFLPETKGKSVLEITEEFATHRVKPHRGVTCVLPTELFVQCYRPAAYTIAGVLIWVGLFVIGLAFPFIEEALGTFCFVFFLVYCLSVAIFSFWILPETKDRSMMEILESFNKLNFRAKKVKEDALTCTRL